MEKGEEKDWFKSAKDFRWQKSKAKFGWWVLMAGIAVEIIIGFALAANDEAEIRQVNENAAKNDPGNLPLNSVMAFVTITYKTSNVISNKLVDSMIARLNGENPLTLNLVTKRVDVISLNAVGHPSIWETQTNARPDTTTFSIALDWDLGWRQFSQSWNRVLNRTNQTAGEIAASDFDVSLEPTFLRVGTIVESGKVEVWFNGPKIERDFSVPPQMIGDFPYLKCIASPNIGRTSTP
jgi:hypothetical protein